MDSQAVTQRFLEAVHARDPQRVARCFTEDASYANVPHPAAVGREAIEAMFAPILGRSEQVRWDIVSESYADGRAWLERVDRFWIEGTEYAIECNGVYEIDSVEGLIWQARDYVDVGVWRTRLGDVL